MKVKVLFECYHGSDDTQEWALKRGLVKGQVYDMEYIEIGQSYSYVTIKGFKGTFNSVLFKFFDENMERIDIFKTPYNPYYTRRYKKGDEYEL